MQNLSFLKEALINSTNNVTLIEVNQKQLKESITYCIKNFVETKETSLILISASQESEQLFKTIKPQNNLFVVDIRSTGLENTKNIFYTNNPSDLTKIQIGIEKFSAQIKGNKTIIFDSLNALSIQSDKRNVQKFFYLFNNKAKLNNTTLIILTAKDSTDEEVLDTIKQFCDKNYDYSDLFISSIELKE